MNIKETLRKYSEEIGIEAIGFCKAEMDSKRLLIYEDRKRSGLQCDFEVIEGLANKIDPSIYLFGAKTFLAILQSYRLEADSPIIPGMGTVSKSANFIDYHTLINDKLALLQGFLEAEYGSQSIAYCDQSPFSDRQIAYEAGLGVIGRNSFLIHEQFGSAVYIGYLLTDLEIEDCEGALQVEYCKDCHLCVDACPNEAILGNGQINAKRCLSYLTQSKNVEAIHKEIMGISLYGCDICQLVCPRNEALHNQVFNPIVPSQVDLKALLELKNEGFKRTFGRTASGWRGKKLLQRNAIIALGNIKTNESVKVLSMHTNDPREDIRREIVVSLGRIHSEAARCVLDEMIKIEKNEAIVQMIRAYLS